MGCVTVAVDNKIGGILSSHCAGAMSEERFRIFFVRSYYGIYDCCDRNYKEFRFEEIFTGQTNKPPLSSLFSCFSAANDACKTVNAFVRLSFERRLAAESAFWTVSVCFLCVLFD